MYCNFTGENECLQSVFTKFEDVEGTHVVIREATRLRIYSEKGEEFIVTLPIPVKSMWSSDFGIILENEIQGDPSQTTLEK